ncbi:MAG: hypothetical protein JSR17_08180 [Proteobacteria bacterium]|nr:hypothetical protein [Pseudomonadota bacterium]
MLGLDERQLIKLKETNFNDIVSFILKHNSRLSNEDAILGAEYLLNKADNFVHLDSKFSISFISNFLFDIVEARKKINQKKVINTENKENDEISVGTFCATIENDKTTKSSESEKSAPPESETPRIIFSKSVREERNLETFSRMSSPFKAVSPTQRLNQFVVLLGEPNLPRRHPGVDDAYHPEKNMDYEVEDLLKRGLTTALLVNKTNSGNLCPNLIFLRTPITEDEDKLTKQIHEGHTLDFYKNNIDRETQKDIEFHFSGHGNDEFIGSLTSDKRLTPDVFAIRIDQLLSSCGLKETLVNKSNKKKDPQQLVFKFHTCNAAFSPEVQESDAPEVIKQKVLFSSAIGKFYRKMIELGYTNIKVMGYRGFYQAFENGSGLTVCDSLSDPKHNFLSDKTLHVIETEYVDGKKPYTKPSVILPKESLYATFEVTLPPKRACDAGCSQ